MIARASVLFCAVSLINLHGETRAGDAVDPTILAFLRAQQSTNLSLLDRGAFNAVVHSSQSGTTVDAKLLVIWSGSDTFVDYTLTRNRTVPRSGEISSTEECRFIETPARLVVYYPRLKFAQFISDRTVTVPTEVRVRPDQAWFSLDAGTIPWLEYIAPDTMTATRLSHEMHHDEKRVVLKRTSSGGTSTTVFSLEHGGNVVSYDNTPSKTLPQFTRNGKYVWEKHPAGMWWLKHYEFKRSIRDAKGTSNWDFAIDIKDFDPKPTIASDQFSQEALKIAAGASIESVSPGKREMLSTAPPRQHVSQEKLDELAESLKKNGFALPDR